MKRVLFGVLLIVLIFCSCNEGIEKSSVSLNLNSLNTAFSLRLNDETYSGDMKITDSGDIELAINTPEAISGITFIAGEDTIKSVYGETSITQESIDINNVFSQLYCAINELKSAAFAQTKEGFEYNSSSFTAGLDSEGNLIYIKTQNGEFNFD